MICQKSAELELPCAQDLVSNFFFEEGQTCPIWGNLEVSFLSWVIFHIVFSQEKKEYDLKWNILKIKNKT